MANVDVLIVNPTSANITVAGDTALAMKATKLTISDADSDLWIAENCAILPLGASIRGALRRKFKKIIGYSDLPL